MGEPTEQETLSGRAHGIWALAATVVSVVMMLADSGGFFLLTVVAAVVIWTTGCEKRGEHYWPASLGGKRYGMHAILILGAGMSVLGLALAIHRVATWGILLLLGVMAYCCVDLIFYDSKKTYEAGLDGDRQHATAIKMLKRSVTINANVCLLIVTIFMAITSFIAQYEEISKQLKKWSTDRISEELPRR